MTTEKEIVQISYEVVKEIQSHVDSAVKAFEESGFVE